MFRPAESRSPNLTADNFKVYEDNQPLDSKKIGLTLLPSDSVAESRVILLVDITGSAADKKALSDAAASFVAGVRKSEPVSVYAFDGGADIRSVADFAKDPNATGPQTLDQLTQMKENDPSRNLYGAVVKGLSKLDSNLGSDSRPVHVGTLVVFTSGPDLAGRITYSDLDKALDTTPYQVVAIGQNADRKLSLDHIGKNGAFEVKPPKTLASAFSDAAARAESLASGYYLLAYCSPSRGGVRRLRVEVDITGKKGVQQSGDTELRFSADGFEAGCDSHSKPSFVVTMVSEGVPGIAQAGKATSSLKGDKKDKKKKGGHHAYKHHAVHHAPSKGATKKPPPKKKVPVEDFEP